MFGRFASGKRVKTMSVLGTALALAILALALQPFGASLAVADDDDDDNRGNSGRGLVKVTPLGSHGGEFCRNDRAILFEDPTGVRVLWDPGRTVDETDARLMDVHAVYLSSVHSDHIGDRKPNPANPGTCASPGLVSAAPDSVTAAIVAAKNSAFLAGGEMTGYMGQKVRNIRGSATPSCPGAGLTNEVVVPQDAPCVGTLRPGGSRTVRMTGASAGVKFANIPAFHSNGIPDSLVDAPGVAPGTTGYGGNDGGAILQFTNGLSVYLTGDTGLSGDMESVVRKFYGAALVVINMGDVFSLGPEEAAFALKEFLKPRTVIPSHVNEEATTGGNPTGARLVRFLRLIRSSDVNVVLPLSGVMREFDGRGRCTNC